MTAALIAVETEDFVAAARTLETDLADPLIRALNRLTNTLDASAAMAGDDAGGQEWAHSYDRAAAGTLNAGQAVANAVTRLAMMFVQTARNYAAADAASDATVGAHVAAAVGTVPCIIDYQLPWCVPPSAAGGSGGPPHGWGFVEHLVGYVWPNGDPGRLRAAAEAWRGCAQVLSSGQCVVGAAVGRAVVDHIPEADDMTLVCGGLQNQLGEAAALFDSMAAACDEFARHIDDAHNAVEDELISLLEWSAGIETAGAIASVFSFGAAEVPTQAAEAGRIAKTAASIASIIERFLAAARALARSVLRLAEQADRLAAAQVGLTGLRLSDVLVTTVSTLPATFKLRALAAIRRLVSEAEPEVLLFVDKTAARSGLPGELSAVSNRFFRDATAKSRDFKIARLTGGKYRMEFFSPANNAGYGKLYVQIVDYEGEVVQEYKDTLGPNGLIERKWLRGKPR